MSKQILEYDSGEEFDFLLIGILCQHKDYRLCHELNRALELNLVREEDYYLYTPKRLKQAAFSMFRFENNDQDVYYILENKGPHSILIPEQKQIDYFLMIKENFKRIDTTELLASIKTIPVVLGAYLIEAKSLKSKEHLVF